MLVSEDISAIVRKRRELERRQEELRRRNAALGRMRSAREQLYERQAEQELCDDIETSLAVTVDAIRDILANLPEGNDQASVEERRRGLTLVRLLMGYCKRKGALLLSDDLDPDAMRLILSEVGTEASAAGIPCAATVSLKAPVKPAVANVAYDCVYDFVLIAYENCGTALIVYAAPGAEAGGITLRLALEIPGLADHSGMLKDELTALLESRGVPYSLDRDELGVRLTVDIPPTGFPAARIKAGEEKYDG